MGMQVNRVFEEIRGHQFYRGVDVVLTLRELGELYCKSNTKEYVCYTLAELAEYGNLRWIDFKVSEISTQFMNQWSEKVLAGAGYYGDYLNRWNDGSRFSVKNFMVGQSQYDNYRYRKWVFENAGDEFGDVEFSFCIRVYDRED
jgi:hypothetical protein